MTRGLLTLFVLCLPVGCSRDVPAHSPAASSESVGVRTVQTQDLPGIADSAAIRLVSEYVRRDADGERLRTSTWFTDAITAPDEEPGYDSFTAIREYAIGKAITAGDTVRVPVRYTVLGGMQQVVDGNKTTGLTLVPHDTSESVVYPVVKTHSRWKIISPQLEQHVLAERILTVPGLPPLKEETRRRLEAASHY